MPGRPLRQILSRMGRANLPHEGVVSARGQALSVGINGGVTMPTKTRRRRARLIAASVIAASGLLVPGTAATAATITDTFDGENGGVPAFDHSELANFSIGAFANGTIDLLGPGRAANPCAGGGVSLCVRMPAFSRLRYKKAISFDAGEQIGIAFDIRRNLGANYGNFNLTVDGQSGFLQFNDIETNLINLPPFSKVGFDVELTNQTPLSDVFTTKYLRFTAGNAGKATFFIDSVHNGIIVDNFVFLTPGGVPEPSAWGLLIAGFGLVGGAMRTNSLRPARHSAA